MAQKEVYVCTPLATQEIAATSHSRVDFETLDEQLSPLKNGHIPQLARVVTYSEEAHPDSPFWVISENHGRSFELKTGRETSRILFADQYGNVFNSISLKGNNLAAPEMALQDNQPGELLVYGLQSSLAIPRIIEASRILRQNGVNTEIILKVMKPTELPLNGEMLPVKDFKAKIPTRKKDEDKEARKKLKGMDLVITVRGMLGGDRLEDLILTAPEIQKNPILDRTYDTQKTQVLQRHGPKTWEGGYNLAGLGRRHHLEFYFSNHLPIELMKNVAGMHKAGLVHKYLTPHNISTSGAIVDLDSVEGKPVGDKQITESEQIKDIECALQSIRETRKQYRVPDFNFRERGLHIYFTFRNWSSRNPQHRDKIIRYAREVIGPTDVDAFLERWCRLEPHQYLPVYINQGIKAMLQRNKPLPR